MAQTRYQIFGGPLDGQSVTWPADHRPLRRMELRNPNNDRVYAYEIELCGRPAIPPSPDYDRRSPPLSARLYVYVAVDMPAAERQALLTDDRIDWTAAEII